MVVTIVPLIPAPAVLPAEGSLMEVMVAGPSAAPIYTQRWPAAALGFAAVPPAHSVPPVAFLATICTFAPAIDAASGIVKEIASPPNKSESILPLQAPFSVSLLGSVAVNPDCPVAPVAPVGPAVPAVPVGP